MAYGTGLLSRLRSLRIRMLRRQEDQEIRELAEFLASIPLFSPLSHAMLIDVADAVHERTYRRDEFVYFEQDPGIGLYVIRSGEVRLLVEDSEGRNEEIRTAGEREIVGLNGILSEGTLRRASSVQAATETRLVGLFTPELRTLQRRNPKTGTALAALFAKQFALVLDETRSALEELQGRLPTARMMAEAEHRVHDRLSGPTQT